MEFPGSNRLPAPARSGRAESIGLAQGLSGGAVDQAEKLVKQVFSDGGLMAYLFDKGAVPRFDKLIKLAIKLGVVEGLAAPGAEILPAQAFFPCQQSGHIPGIGMDVQGVGGGGQFLQGPEQGLQLQPGGRGLGETSGPHPVLQPGAGQRQAGQEQAGSKADFAAGIDTAVDKQVQFRHSLLSGQKRVMPAGQVEILHLLACPGGTAEEFEARLDRGIVIETADADQLSQLFPAVIIDQSKNDLFQGDAV